LKILYITASGNIHDYRFLSKLVNDYEVLLLHYACSEMLDEIKTMQGLKIISRKSFIRSFPLSSGLSFLRKIYREFQPDIVHTGYAWQVGILASRLNLHPHLSMVWGSDVLVEPDKHFFLKPLVRKVMNQCDHIQCDAEVVKQKIISDYKINSDKITVFPWGIDLNLFKPMDKMKCREKLNMNKNDFVVVFTRSLEKIYGINYLLEGFKIFSKNKPEAKLYLLANGSKKSEVMKQLNDSIKFIGRLPNNEIPIYLNAADVYLSPSLSDGTSLSLLEAMACGLGIVVTDVPAIREWISSENGIIIEKEDPAAIAEALENYYKNRGLNKEHGEKNIRIASEKANWDKNYLKLKEIYRNLTSEKK
jgi:L-malate glycosyltransferase